jgi:Zn-dependent peptidase ImmA (M78 family)
MKACAREVRAAHGLISPRVLLTDLRRIYGAHGIHIDLWTHKLKRLRGAYFCDELGPSVMINGNLPQEPKIFTMAHELKHHLCDQGLNISYCDSSNVREPIEIGAEIFAAELIFPETDFKDCLTRMGVGLQECTPEVLIRLKRETNTTLSYSGLAKRAIFMGYATEGSFAQVKWKKLEEKIYGEPVYKRILRYRNRL